MTAERYPSLTELTSDLEGDLANALAVTVRGDPPPEVIKLVGGSGLPVTATGLSEGAARDLHAKMDRRDKRVVRRVPFERVKT